MRLIAAVRFAYRGKVLEPLDEFDAPDGEARTLIATTRAMPWSEPQPEPPKVYTRKRSPIAARPAGARTRPRQIH